MTPQLNLRKHLIPLIIKMITNIPQNLPTITPQRADQITILSTITMQIINILNPNSPSTSMQTIAHMILNIMQLISNRTYKLISPTTIQLYITKKIANTIISMPPQYSKNDPATTLPMTLRYRPSTATPGSSQASAVRQVQ
jgi:hypothetical protein